MVGRIQIAQVEQRLQCGQQVPHNEVTEAYQPSAFGDDAHATGGG
jgi:hypothetical protein